MWETQVRPLGWEDVLEKGMATHSSIPAWRIPWTEEPGKQHPWDREELDMTKWLTHTHTHTHIHIKHQPWRPAEYDTPNVPLTYKLFWAKGHWEWADAGKALKAGCKISFFRGHFSLQNVFLSPIARKGGLNNSYQQRRHRVKQLPGPCFVPTHPLASLPHPTQNAKLLFHYLAYCYIWIKI